MTEDAAARRLQCLASHLIGSTAAPLSGTAAGPGLQRQPCRAAAPAPPAPAAVPPQDKVVTAEQAVALIKDGSVLTVGGFVGSSCPEALLAALRARWDAESRPAGLHLYFNASTGNFKGRGLDQLAAPGLLARATYSWAGSAPALLRLVREKQVQAWNLPLGVMAHMFREVAAKRPGPVTRVGLGTFVDPREKGGKLTGPEQQDAVELVRLGGRDLLWYRAPPAIHCALLRGTTADLDGNVSFEKEALFFDQLPQAMAVHNSGGLVIVQVERLAAAGSLPPRAVHLPGAIVNKVVVAPLEQHWQTFASPLYDPALSGQHRAPASAIAVLPLGERRAICHRAMLEIEHPGSVINLGIGMPEGVANMVISHGHQNPAAANVHLSTEAGALGGVPAGGLRFGNAANAASHMPCASMIDFYNGGGVDLACLGMAEVDEEGNVNVSNFGADRMPGCGGFIDISQTAKKVIFVGTLTSGGLKVSMGGGKLTIQSEGRVTKFRKRVHEKTFAATSACGREILYITERAVFRLREGRGVELTEVAPGVDLEHDIIGRMGFRPIMQDVKLMDPRIFSA